MSLWKRHRGPAQPATKPHFEVAELITAWLHGDEVSCRWIITHTEDPTGLMISLTGTLANTLSVLARVTGETPTEMWANACIALAEDPTA